jgi:threonine dehydrogenase-like Zn-dependent dehydrogenase
MGIKIGGNLALLAACGPMGLAAINYIVYGPNRPRLLVVTDIDQGRLDRAASIITPAKAAQMGVDLRYVNTSGGNALQDLKDIAGGQGYDDVFVFAPVAPLIEQGDAILAKDACLNFFAGPTDTQFSAKLNFYAVHYAGTHIAGTSGGTKEDMIEALRLMSEGAVDPSMMITHVGGLTAAKDTTLNLPSVPGGKKLLYTHFDFPLTPITEFASRPEPFFQGLAAICSRHNGLWSPEAEQYLLAHAPALRA